MFNPLPWAGPGRSLARKMLLLSPVFSFPCQSLPAPSRLCECDHSLASATAHALTPPWCHWSPPSTMIAWVTIGCSQHKFRRIYICFPIISLGPGKWCYQKHGFYDKTDNTEKSFWNVFYFYVFFFTFYQYCLSYSCNNFNTIPCYRGWNWVRMYLQGHTGSEYCGLETETWTLQPQASDIVMLLDLIQTQAIYWNGENASEIGKPFWYLMSGPNGSFFLPPSSSSSSFFNVPNRKHGGGCNSWDMRATWGWIPEAHLSPGLVLVWPWGSNGSSPEDDITGESIALLVGSGQPQVHWVLIPDFSYNQCHCRHPRSNSALTEHEANRHFVLLFGRIPPWTCFSNRMCIIMSSITFFSRTHQPCPKGTYVILPQFPTEMQKAPFSICMHISAHRGQGRPWNALQTDILIFPCSFLAQILTNGFKYYKFNLIESATSSPCRIQMSPSYSATRWCYINTWMNKIFLFCWSWLPWLLSMLGTVMSTWTPGWGQAMSSNTLLYRPDLHIWEESILFPYLCSVQLFHFEKTAIFPLHYLGIFGEHQLFIYTWVYF